MEQLREGELPRHIGIILDGNRRFGRRRNIEDPRALYALGADKLDELLSWCTTLEIPAITLWVCSTKNLQRPAREVSGILAAIQNKLSQLAVDPLIHQHQVRVRAAGRLDLLPTSTRAAIEAAEEATKEHGTLVLTIAVAYDGREELVDALRSILRKTIDEARNPDAAVDEISTETIAQHLYVPDLPDADLIIRTSGELRLSGFLLWQSAYSEIYFTEIDWPEFRKIDFLRALRAYQRRHRRFGL
ncbi:polyprenyl diphosphate synthase [Pelagibius marinus]|uniref:polyprenyl diphosphate synthase n=1 Tax=Pelagibius marinus TaxID=2762760 RepID=UPI001D04D33E|nr:polyprenyl diphosphate synthase [Pelagibius marinus]